MADVNENKDAIPYVCYYNGLSLLNQQDFNPQANLLLGFNMKKELFSNHSSEKTKECTKNLQQAFNKNEN
tara:strand:+ start:1060 stop:1269 length:210 start_codon:yes stop_codon:yes gene_type:complete